MSRSLTLFQLYGYNPDRNAQIQNVTLYSILSFQREPRTNSIKFIIYSVSFLALHFSEHLSRPRSCCCDSK